MGLHRTLLIACFRDTGFVKKWEMDATKRQFLHRWEQQADGPTGPPHHWCSVWSSAKNFRINVWERRHSIPHAAEVSMLGWISFQEGGAKLLRAAYLRGAWGCGECEVIARCFLKLLLSWACPGVRLFTEDVSPHSTSWWLRCFGVDSCWWKCLHLPHYWFVIDLFSCWFSKITSGPFLPHTFCLIQDTVTPVSILTWYLSAPYWELSRNPRKVEFAPSFLPVNVS